MGSVLSRALTALIAAGAFASCSFSPDVAGSKIDCAGGRPCPEGWICPMTGDKVCIPIESGSDAGTDATGSGHTKVDGGSGSDAGPRDTGGACRDDCPSDRAVACTGDSAYHICGIGGDGCLAWGAEQHCTGKCTNDQCEGCNVDCTDRECGEDGCSGSCGACTRPPASLCKDNRTVTSYEPDGTCTDGACTYTGADADCSYGCFNGACASCTPSCAGKECGDDGCGVDCAQCDHAPASSCVSATRLRHYDKAGTCAGNRCSYTSQEIDCPNGCENAQCKNCTPSCAGRQCGSDGCGGDCGGCGAYAVCNAQGQCECAVSSRLNCNSTWNDGCEVDRSTDRFNCGNCGNACSLANASVVSCVGGLCKVSTCAQDYGNCNGQDADGCEATLTTDTSNCAQCGKKCDTPPAGACLADGKTLREHDAQGTCAGSACSYTSHDTTCPNTCVNAQCTACQPSCTGKDCGDNGCGGSCGACNSPPADTCANASTLRKFSGPGTCGGTFKCTYAYADTNCPNGCAGARCQACSPSCAGKDCGDDGCGGSCGACSSPPADTCASASTLRKFSGPGACGGTFTCTYAYADTNCPNGCAGAQCQACSPSCAGKDCGDDSCGGSCGACNSPPPDTCISGKTLRQYNASGTCNAGFTCDYPYQDSDCLNDCAGNSCQGCSCLGKHCGDDDGCGGTCGD